VIAKARVTCSDEPIHRPGDLAAPKDFPADAPQRLNLYDGAVSPTETIDMAVFEDRKNP
jgi:hypothetical protein